jgi:hypothetical protein
MICPTCKGRAGWWVNAAGLRVPPPGPPGFFEIPKTWHRCPDCIGGIASCCDAAGSQQPEPEPEEKK